jgi:hypothetical protein
LFDKEHEVETQELEFDCESQPLEFALIVLDLITEEGIDPSDSLMMDPEALNGGFGISLQFGEHIDLTLAYNEKSKNFTGLASVSDDKTSAELLRTALLLNSEMPNRRRFLMNNAGRLGLQETWSVVDLEVAALAAGLHRLIEFVNLMVFQQERKNPALNVAGGIRG